MNDTSHLRLKPLVTALLIATAATHWTAPSAFAQAAAPAAARDYDFPAGPLAATLNRIAREAGLALTADAGLMENRQAAPVRGHFDAPEALRRALTGTGLELMRTTAGGYTLRRASAPAQPASSVEAVLPAVTVTAESDRSNGKASQGYRTRKSAVAGFSDQDIIDTPLSVTVLPAELLANQKVETIASLDRLDAGVTSSATNAGSYSSPSIRGFGLDNWSNFRYNGLMLVNQQAMGLENKERIEILKGLSALQAGFAAPAGLINYVTKRPAAAPVNDLHLSAGQYGNAKAHADLSRRSEDGRFGIRVNAALEEERSYVREVDGNRQFVSLAGDWRVTPDTLLQIDVEHERRDQITQPDLIADVTGRLPSGFNPRTFLGQTWSTYPTEFTLVGGKLEHLLGDKWSIVAEANWMKLRRDQNGFYLDNLQSDGEVRAYLYYAPDQTREPVTARVMAKGAFTTGVVGHDVVFGYTAHRHKTRWPNGFWDLVGTTNIYNPRVIADPGAVSDPAYEARRVSERGVFVNDVLALGDAWRLHLGGRYAMRDEKSFTSTGAMSQHYDRKVFSPSAAVVFKPRTDVSTYVSYIEGLEQGGTAPQTASNPNEVMAPLVSKQWETGVKAELGTGLSAAAALFRIDRPAEYRNSAGTYVQDGLRRHQGLEFSLTGKVSREWTLFGSAMLLDAELKDTGNAAEQGKRPAGVPKHRLALTTEYSPQALAGWTFLGSWTHTGDRPLDAANTGDFAPGYDVVGLGARYVTRFGGAPTTLRLHVDNLFDKHYWANVQNGSLTAGAPRMVSASVSMQF